MLQLQQNEMVESSITVHRHAFKKDRIADATPSLIHANNDRHILVAHIAVI